MAGILIVDDDETYREATRELLRRAGHDASMAADGGQALSSLDAFPFEIVIVRYALPDLSGPELRAQAAEIRPDAIFIFTHDDPDSAVAVHAVRDQGAHDLIPRDAPPTTIIRAIRSALEARNNQIANTPGDEYSSELEMLVVERTQQLIEYSDRLKLTAESTRLLATCLTFEELARQVLSVLTGNLVASSGALFQRKVDRWQVVVSEDPDSRLNESVAFDARIEGLFDHDVVTAADFMGKSPTADPWDGFTGDGVSDAPSLVLSRFLDSAHGTIAALPMSHASGDMEGVILLHRADGPAFGERDLELARLILAHAMESAKSIRLTDSLRRSEARFHRMTANVPGVVFQFHYRDRKIISMPFVSESATEIFAVTAETLRTTPDALIDRLEAEERPSFHDSLAVSASTKAPWRWEGRYHRTPSDVRWLQFGARPMVQDDGTIIYDGLAIDITEHKEMELQLQLADRMVSVGTLAAGVAHEINNPLTYVLANLALVRDELHEVRDSIPRESRIEIETILGEASEGAERVRRIVRDLKVFSRADEKTIGPVQLERVLNSSINMSMNEIRHRAQLIREDGPPTPPVQANESKLGQVFLNLLINAAQAIPEGDASQHTIRVRTMVAPGGAVQVEVADSGPGIPPNVIKRIFDPFFTTKPVGVGTGLGLPICHRIIAELGGDITVQSTVGRGTVFTVSLQPSDVQDHPTWEGHRDPSVENPSFSVLIVDDERGVTSALAHALREHDVLVAHSGRQALDQLRVKRFDVILCDLMMPDFTGMDVYEAVKERWPEQERRIVFMTGGAFTTRAHQFLESISNQRIEKPFDMSRVREVLRRIVEETQGAAAAAPDREETTQRGT